MNDRLIFKNPPSTWEQYLPLGNGRLAVMQKSHPCNESLQLNEENVWSGGPQDRVNPDMLEYLPEIRSLIKRGKVAQAQELVYEAMSGTSFNERVYQTAGNLNIDFFSESGYGIPGPLPPHVTSKKSLETYKAELNLKTASACVSYTDDEGVVFTRTTWISAADDMIFMQVKASVPGKINFRAGLDRGIWCDKVFAKDGFIVLEDSHGIPFAAGAGVIAKGGETKTVGVNLTGRACDEALFFIDIQTYRWDKKNISKEEYDKIILKNTWTPLVLEKLSGMKSKLSKGKFEDNVNGIFEKHLKEYSSYYDRFSLNIGNACDEKEIPTPELLKAASKSNTELVNLYCNFSRYLLIASSRKPGVLPATLQGLWNCYMDPPWGSKYTVNINLQMNYWPALMCNLSETHEAVFEILERSYEKGVITAKKMYNCSGYVVHHNLDYWGDAAPQDCWLPGTYWVLGAAWIATHIWEHYEYTQDKKLLERYYYLMHEACRFFVDFLTPCDIKAPDGKPYLIVNPSVSPENSYVTKAGEIGALTAGCEMDNMILEHLFKGCINAYKALGKSAHNNKGKTYSDSEIKAFEDVLQHIKGPELNSDGSLMEWNEEVEEVEPGHRHVSHLYGLFPGHTISVQKTPEFAEAAKKTLEKRLKNGGGHTGWSQAWIINFRAALRQGNEALTGIETLFTHSTLPNLLDNHPPFQIDGNFGALAGIVRLVVQSEMVSEKEVNVYLLPSLPEQKEWQTGSIRGARLRGNLLIDFDWENGKPVNVKITSADGGKPSVKVNVL